MDRAAFTKSIVLECMVFDQRVEPTDLPLSLLEYITDGFSEHKQIGRGGFAVVYKGMLMNGTIAVKKLLNNYLHENKFNQEVQCLMKAKHKNIVRFLGYCADTQGKAESYNGKFVMADVPQRLLCFEYLPKGSLRDYITDASRVLAWTQYYQIIKGICAGLHYLHENCIVHLDLKPSNILFDDNLVPKIADFGLSRCFDESQSHVTTSKLYGTLGYIAPEVYSGRITFKSDIYSLGVIIIEILTGQKMYPEDYDVLESWGNRLEKLHREKQLEQLRVRAEIGKECTDYSPGRRPDARTIVCRLDEVDIVDRYTVTDLTNLSIPQEIHKVEEHGDENQLFGVIGHEHWIYVCCNLVEWSAYALERQRWIQVPKMPGDEYFKCGDKQSLAVGRYLLVFGRDSTRPILLVYSILTNSWIQTTDAMNYYPCCRFGSTSVGQKAYLAGGTDYSDGRVSSAAAMYDCEEQVWEPLPSMNRARQLCSAVFMDGKLYVIGGVGNNGEVLACGEEYDFERPGSWRLIDNMLSEGLMTRAQTTAPLVAVVNNELYAAGYRNKVNKYDKQNNRWITLGKFPGIIGSSGWGIGFKACGDKLIAITSMRLIADIGGGAGVNLDSWVPNEQPLTWNSISHNYILSALVCDSAVMSC